MQNAEKVIQRRNPKELLLLYRDFCPGGSLFDENSEFLAFDLPERRKKYFQWEYTSFRSLWHLPHPFEYMCRYMLQMIRFSKIFWPKQNLGLDNHCFLPNSLLRHHQGVLL